ncbi:cation-transporting P-type ATPase [Mycoplasma phocoeninasale]|uniref:Cation-transporting P-type ATPase n=1 Tax=Mycoplasma phocoeninasale TaxID=2726117 RepID=A0A858U1L8_9MOLU|nr:cation-transporting P-type ATPase [Mycoplasma phocoeninasale]QJG66292.1 cation-transporting P-type ATPase [Mycoplasma phocoeninasale]
MFRKNKKNQDQSPLIISKEKYLQTDIHKGLSSQEAISRQEIFGKNELAAPKKINPFIAYLAQFKDILVIILLLASLLSYILAIVDGVRGNWNWSENNNRLLVQFIEPSIILLVVLTNSAVGAVQEIKSAQAIDALRKLSPLQTKVIRNGNLIVIDAIDVVVGDIVLVESGDIVPADGILLNSSNLAIIESSLTGESEPSQKDYSAKVDMSLPMADRKFMVYSSTIVATGTAHFIVTEIGKQTEIGRISNLVNNQKEAMSPLQLKITKLGKIFGYVGLGLFVLSLLVQIIFQAASGNSFNSTIFWSTSIVNAISLAVAAIPEGLIAFSSIILAIGVQKMAKKRAIVKDLLAVESLGSCAIICSDKTGTLTQNKMSIIDYYDGKKINSENKIDDSVIQKIIEYGSLCSEANLIVDNNEYKIAGDPTEISFLYELEKHTKDKYKSEMLKKYPRQFVIPFDSDRKLMTTINKINSQDFVITKGAPDILLSLCTNLTKEEYEKALEVNNLWSSKAYRVLAVAYKVIDDKLLADIKKTNDAKIAESNLSFVGLVAMVDPPRESAKMSIQECISAGIKPIMITGDSINTAMAIATELGIYSKDRDLAITGSDLDKISDEELTKTIEKYSVYARVKPEDKLRIVSAWQKRDQVVAMTGDGVNDAPALKAADIGCAMGITGTEASKQAANMILADDNFSTIVQAVDNGRTIYQKIKNVIQNLLITSIAEIILVFFGLLIFKAVFSSEQWKAALGGQELYILSATQLLWINLFTHGIPAIALGLQDSKENYMNRRPISKYESIFAKGMGINTLWQGILIGILSLVAYYLGALYALKNNNGQNILQAGSTLAFLVLGITAAFNSVNLMSKKPVILLNPLFFWKVYLSVIFSISFLLLVAFVPKIALVFNGYENFAFEPTLIAYGLGLPLIIIPIYTIKKLILYKKQKDEETNRITHFELILRPKQRKKINQKQ